MTSTRTTIRVFWADVLGKASEEELVGIIDTLAARQASADAAADSDLLVLARSMLQRRRQQLDAPQ
jgi:hypothetical protein